MEKTKPLIHYKPVFREETYCGLNPSAEKVRGQPIKVTQMRSKNTCPDCEGLPKT